jgi:hypothetical protein
MPSNRAPIGVVALLLVAITLISHIGIIANPGFFSHDEWQKFDHVEQHGYRNFALAYGRVHSGPEFGHPVRPLGFLQQGATSIWMERAPILTHLFDVLLHAAIAVVVFFGIRNVSASEPLAWLSAIFFTLSPLTTMATGWMAASFDQWYALFALIVCWIAYRTALDGLTPPRAVGLLLAASGAILSKETALVLPGVALLAATAALLHRGSSCVKPWSIAISIAIVLVPLIAYMAIRFPALANSLAGNSHASYTPSLEYFAENLSYYFAYPFLITLTKLDSIFSFNTISIALATVTHLLLVIAIWFYFGAAYALLYLVAYFAFLLPVLPIPILGSHYLYGSSVPLAIALSTVVLRAQDRRHRTAAWLGGFMAGALVVHAFWIQGSLYGTGRCQTTFLSTLETRIALERQRGAPSIAITPVPGAPYPVGVRAIFGRDRYSGAQGPATAFYPQAGGEDPPSNAVRVVMNHRCEVR